MLRARRWRQTQNQPPKTRRRVAEACLAACRTCLARCESMSVGRKRSGRRRSAGCESCARGAATGEVPSR